jgi:hypothetical protein
VSEFLTWHDCAKSGGWVLCIGAGQHQFGWGQKLRREVVRHSCLDVIPCGRDIPGWTEAKRQRAPLGAPPVSQCLLCAGEQSSVVWSVGVAGMGQVAARSGC